MKKYFYLTLLLSALCCSIFYISNQQPDTAKKSKIRVKNTKERDRPDLAVEQNFEMTKDPALGYPPTERKIDAFHITRKLFDKKSNSKAIANVSWDERGPNNVGGRTRALFFDPNDASGNKVWAAAVTGGIWYNNDITDPDSEWQNVDDFMANLAVSSMAYDPQNTNIFYAGTGLGFTNDARGSGLWKSVDGGTTWNHLTNTGLADDNSFHYTQKIEITETSKIIAGTFSGVQTSTDGGENWIVTLEERITDIDLASDGTLYASDYSGNIYKSTDEAETWENILSGEGGFRVELASAPSDPLTLYAVSEASNRVDVGYFKKTSDGGETWTDVTIPRYSEQSCTESSSDFARGQAFFDLILAVYPNDPESVIVGGIDLHKSTDGGASWDLISYWTGSCGVYVHADQHAITFKPGSSTTALFGNDGGVFYSDDLDADKPNIKERINGYNTALFYSCAATNEGLSNVYLAGAQDNGSNKFDSPGINSTTEVTGGDGAFVFIDQDNPNIMITSYVYNSYYRSLDGGQSFERFTDGNQGRFINPSDYDDGANILYAAHDNNSLAVYENIDGAQVKSSVKNISIGGKISHLSVSPFTEHRVFIGNGSSGIYMLDNANTNQQLKKIDNNQLPSGAYVSCIEIGSSDDHLLAILSNYGVVSVWETTDGGTTWNNKEGNLPDMPVRWALYNPENRKEVLLATEFGIWSTDDISVESPEWEPTVEGLANVQCNMLQYRKSDQQIIVATFGRGLYTSFVFNKDVLVDFIADRSFSYIGSNINFENLSIGEITDYHWDFGDGNTSTEKNPSHKFNVPGNYAIKLTVNKESVSQQRNITILPNRDANYKPSDGGDFEEFEDFAALNISGTPFELGESETSGKEGTSSGNKAWVTGLNANYVNNSKAALLTPHFDFSQIGNYTLSFKTKYSFEDEWDGFIVEYTIDSGRTWTKLNDQIEDGWYNQTSDPQSVFGVSVPIFSGNTNGEFVTQSTDVSFLEGSPRVGFKILFLSDAAEVDAGMAIDDFELSAPKSDAIPNFSSTTSDAGLCEINPVTFHDRSSGAITSYSWDFGDGATPATAIGRGPHEVTYSTFGTKDVSLSVLGELNGNITETKNGYLTVGINTIQEKTVVAQTTGVCINESGIITANDTDAGFTYQLFNATQNTPIGGKVEGNGGDLEFNTGALSLSTTFFIKVMQINSTCSKILTDQPEITVMPPSYTGYNFTALEICEGNTIEATVEASESGVNYSLYNITGQEIISDAFEGNGDALTITSFPVMDTIDVQIIASSGNCSISFDPIAINAIPLPDPVITSDGSTLICSPLGGSYQWFLNDEPLGLTTNTIQARYLGEYTVELSINGCTMKSEAFTATVLGLEELVKAGELKIYPNPTSGLINIDQKGKFTSLKIYNMMGQVVLTRDVLFHNEMLSLSMLQPGQYIMELNGPNDNVKVNIQKAR